LPRIRESAPARIVTVASRAHVRQPGIDFAAVRERTRSSTGLAEYGVSKLANVLFSAELARRLAGSGVTTYSLHPGVVKSDIWRGLPGPILFLAKLGMITDEEGAQTTLYCATSPQCANETGLYYDKAQVRTPSKVARDEALAKKLWQQSEAWIA
jgi:NAD(P)-dependent dehydrogenase (short-subunit alcohol dehydrogenase family)